MFERTNPASGEKLEPIPEMDDAAVEAALARADATFRQWRTSALDERTALLARLGDLFEAEKERLAEIATREMGKTLKSSIAEVEKCAAAFRHYAKHGPEFLEQSDVVVSKGAARIRWLPLGPVLAVMPWNFPYWQVVRFMAPAIMAGNVGLLKHASITQGVAAALAEMVKKAGGPDGLFQNLAIKSGAVDKVISDDRVVAVTLTGSEGAGSKVAETAGRKLKKVVLELGGSDPFIVMPSADIDEAAKQAVTARIQNTGQSCICGKRMIVHSDVYDEFAAKFFDGMKAVKAGDPMDDGTDMGPLSSFEQRDTVLEQLDRMQKAGATLEFGGEKLDSPGAYLTAGVLTGVPRDADVAKEEVFGPIAMLFRVDDIDEAITLANDIPYGLGSSVWTSDAQEQERFERDIAAGMTAVNQMLSSTPEAPFGGVKLSGHGRELGPWGMHEFMNMKTVLMPG
ncbi:NAD-dependent succinate-semialdehyde dehydrogenase [Stakelama pacifica]|uniref:Succinate-semialdehyde dehydrogenase/glutarate-semialdehyde dehydrogenase n=1 Tax=Stakelama pacifica TaxID=517720 RepID=A0A4R6FRX3_9SPHN|nr:NAD-dependent succinate-semialdehyde dehydrogenase [Stakelama pacifica]TDN84526.1 succinate-semialdehyde dehydrogenase/glutarate-semialdehyde dehydrogenase [Stakelama pacifica]GGO93550.1 NADP-dependent succinic semialdehyde dehydrogenase [Stakelama pacifica]